MDNDNQQKPQEEIQYPVGECPSCRHDGNRFHRARWFDESTKQYKYGCCKVDCPCMRFGDKPK